MRCPTLCLGVLSLLLPATALAGHFTVAPIQVFLDARARTELLEVTNHSPRPIQVQVQGFAWSQTPAGEAVLTPSQALVVFPSLLELAPGASRKLRVGTLGAPTAREESFRLLVTELPGDEGVGPGQIGMRLRLSIPVFLTPKGARPALALGPLSVVAGAAEVRLDNRGAAHGRARAARIVGEDASGAVVLDQKLSAWYVLAGEARAYVVGLPPERCRDLARLTVTVEAEGEVLRTSAQGPFACPDPE